VSITMDIIQILSKRGIPRSTLKQPALKRWSCRVLDFMTTTPLTIYVLDLQQIVYGSRHCQMTFWVRICPSSKHPLGSTSSRTHLLAYSSIPRVLGSLIHKQNSLLTPIWRCYRQLFSRCFPPIALSIRTTLWKSS
jgi:hypothetical protein